MDGQHSQFLDDVIPSLQTFQLQSAGYNFIYVSVGNTTEKDPSEDPLAFTNFAEQTTIVLSEGYHSSIEPFSQPIIVEHNSICDFAGLEPCPKTGESLHHVEIVDPSPVSQQISRNEESAPVNDDDEGTDKLNLKFEIIEDNISCPMDIDVSSTPDNGPDSFTEAPVEHETFQQAKPDGIQLSVSKSTEGSGKRIYDKLQVCLYCKANRQQMARHLRYYHKNEPRVKALLKLPVNSKERRVGFSLLLREGNYKHNCDVLKSNDGTLILSKRPSRLEAKGLDPNDYEACPLCLGFILKKRLKLHLERCSSQKTSLFKPQSASENLSHADDSDLRKNDVAREIFDNCDFAGLEPGLKTGESRDHLDLICPSPDSQQTSGNETLSSCWREALTESAPVNDRSTPGNGTNSFAIASIEHETFQQAKPDGIQLSVSKSTEGSGKRIYDKLQVCLYCKTNQQKMARHLRYNHKNEPRVKALLKLPVNSKERRVGFSLLLREGNYKHNCDVLKSNDGTLILSKRPSRLEAKGLDPNDYEACPLCLGFILKKRLKLHLERCSSQKTSLFKPQSSPENLSHADDSDLRENDVAREILDNASADGSSSHLKMVTAEGSHNFLQPEIVNTKSIKRMPDNSTDEPDSLKSVTGKVNNTLSSPQRQDGKEVRLSISNKNRETGGRIYDKVQCCLFCQRKVKKIGRHLLTNHHNQKRVQALMDLPVNSRQRTEGFALLTREGNYHHNCRVLETGKGELILARRPGKLEARVLDPSDFRPCTLCLAFVRAKHMTQHERHSCIFRKVAPERGRKDKSPDANHEDRKRSDRLKRGISEQASSPEISEDNFMEESPLSNIDDQTVTSGNNNDESSSLSHGDLFSDRTIGKIEASPVSTIVPNKGSTTKNGHKTFKKLIVLVKRLPDNFQLTSKPDGMASEPSCEIDPVSCLHTKDCNSSMPDAKASAEATFSLSTVRRKRRVMNPKFSVSKKNEKTGSRIYDKLHSCLFCRTRIYHIARHLKSCHSNEERVKSLIALPVNTKERHEGFSLLLREGDYHHNCQVIESNEGELILARRPDKLEASYRQLSDYEPCPNCLGFVMKTSMKQHRKKCPLLSGAVARSVVKIDGKKLTEEAFSGIEGPEDASSVSTNPLKERLPTKNTSETDKRRNGSRSQIPGNLQQNSKQDDLELNNLSSEVDSVSRAGSDDLDNLSPNDASTEVKNISSPAQKEKWDDSAKLPVVRKKEKTGSRMYDKLHSCVYCQIKIYKIGRHLQLCHKNEERVKPLLALPVSSKERQDGFSLLVREGDYHHNCRVIESNEGELLLARRPDKFEAKYRQLEDYVPCPKCLGFLLKKTMWKHRRQCPYPFKDGGKSLGRVDGNELKTPPQE